MAVAAECGFAEDFDFSPTWKPWQRADAGWFGSKIAHAIGAAVKEVAKHDPISNAISKIAHGQNVGAALLSSARQVGGDLKAIAPYAAVIASTVPGLGTGLSAAISAGSSLASGKGLSAALVDGIKGALPGGPVAAAAFDAGLKLAAGGKLTDVAISAARSQLPPEGQKALDIGLAVAHGQNLQQLALSQIGQVLPGGPAGAAAKDLLRRVSSGESVLDAAKALGGDAAIRAAQSALGQVGGDMLTHLSSAEDVAKAIMAQPELHGLTPAAVAARLGVPLPMVGDALSRATELVRRAASAPMTSSHDPIPLSMPRMGSVVVRAGDSFDRLLETQASKAAPASMSPGPTLPTEARAALHAFTWRAFGARPPAAGWWGGSSWGPRRRATHLDTMHRHIRHAVRAAAGLDATGTKYVVESGDYPARIADKLTGNASRYTDLLDANPSKKQYYYYTISNQDGSVSETRSAQNPYSGASTLPDGRTVKYASRNFASLQPGETLNVPVSWVKSSVTPGPSVSVVMTDQQLWTAKSMLAAWGVKERAIQPPDYGGSDLADASGWSNRSRQACQSYQVWANARGEKLPTDGTLDAATLASLTAYTAGVASTLPQTPVPQTPIPQVQLPVPQTPIPQVPQVQLPVPQTPPAAQPSKGNDLAPLIGLAALAFGLGG